MGWGRRFFWYGNNWRGFDEARAGMEGVGLRRLHGVGGALEQGKKFDEGLRCREKGFDERVETGVGEREEFLKMRGGSIGGENGMFLNALVISD